MNNTFSWRILRVGSLRECLDAWQQSVLYQQLDDRLKISSEIVLDELGSNFLRYSGAKSKEMLFSAEYANDELMLTFNDDGVAFDPTEVPDAPKGNIALLPVGGRGIHMVRRCVDSWVHRREENRNINILRKQLPLDEPEPEPEAEPEVEIPSEPLPESPEVTAETTTPETVVENAPVSGEEVASPPAVQPPPIPLPAPSSAPSPVKPPPLPPEAFAPAPEQGSGDKS